MKKRRAGRKKFRETRQPNNKTRVWLGTFSHPDMAAIAYDVAPLAFKGETASLIFPHAATSLPRLDSQTSSIRSIQFASTKAVEKHLSSCQDLESFVADIAMNGSESADYNVNGCVEKFLEDSDGFFWDEEEVYNMPGLINSMAEGLIMTPPALQRGFNWVGGETTMDLSLWEN
ncbi:putative transcription factor AP2-EREBP family [Medicago truncatula]|uniref:CBF/DREB1 transcription factor n=1 Tax=Medicago truncatula TaxID=3880 RepID=A0A072VVF7_MEDTR|nr:dehydration-responsive element-binding protein 1B [Medicago truncatula]KEH42085.1 CBF/DREB1 transcription factor [Medicago truncatula]RHN79605.1 putative transcription factor AP2-EREBP family [Medicago truncatula]